MFNLDENLNAGTNVVPVGYRQIFVTPAMRANLFPVPAVSPWIVSAEVSVISARTRVLIYSSKTPDKSTPPGVFHAGIGLDVRVLYRFSVRGEARDVRSGEPAFPLTATKKTSSTITSSAMA